MVQHDAVRFDSAFLHAGICVLTQSAVIYACWQSAHTPCIYIHIHVYRLNRDRSTTGSAIRLIYKASNYRRCSQISTDLHTDIQAYIRLNSETFDVDNTSFES